MAHSKYYKRSEASEIEVATLMTQRQIYNRKPEGILFYELEPAVVIDVIRDETHPIFKNKREYPKVSTSEWPTGYNNIDTPDYSWIGRIKARQIVEQESTPVGELDWVIPLENTIREFPLVNELVIISQYMGSKYYSRRLNTRNFINTSADFRYEHRYGKTNGVDSDISANLVGARNPSDISVESNKYGLYLGKYYKVNHKTRPLKHYEGDTIFESRFGSSMRFGCYVDNPDIDRGTSLGHGESHDDNLGNPMILIRNRQKATTEDETTYQYNILEDVNQDGSSIQLTSGNTRSSFISTISHTYDNIDYGCIGCTLGGFAGLYRLSKSDIGNKKIKSLKEETSVSSYSGVSEPSELDSLNPANDPINQLDPYTKTSDALKKGGPSAVVGVSIGMATNNKVGSLVGERLTNIGTPSINKFISAPGSPTSQSPSEKKKFSKSLVSGNFSLNSTYERGIISAGKAAKGAATKKLMGSSVGPAFSAANSLGISIPKLNDLGIGPNDSPMFKIFKLAAFGMKAMCANLNGQDGNSTTENKLGWLLSIGIDLTLLALLMALFNKLRNLKFNFGGFGGIDLDNLLFDLCDWINNIDYKNNLVDTFKNETNKMLTDADLTKQLGDGFKQKGTYDSYARNNTGFDLNYKSLTGDVDAIKEASKSFGQTNIGLSKDKKDIAQVKFDPLTGLFREKENNGISQPPTFSASALDLSLPTKSSSNKAQPANQNTKIKTPIGGANIVIPKFLSTDGESDIKNMMKRDVTPVGGDATEVVSFMSGKTITKESLSGTVLETADLNAVALLDESDLDVLTDVPRVSTAIKDAETAYEDTFNMELEKSERILLKRTDTSAIFGKQLPELKGNQIVINSERVLISSKTQETGIFSKKKFFVTTDDEITLDAKERIVIRSDKHISLATASVHLGSYTSQCHPTLKGDCTTAWLSDLCGWLSSHVHHDPYITTSRPAQQGQLASLRARLPTLLSERIFISG